MNTHVSITKMGAWANRCNREQLKWLESGASRSPAASVGFMQFDYSGKRISKCRFVHWFWSSARTREFSIRVLTVHCSFGLRRHSACLIKYLNRIEQQIKNWLESRVFALRNRRCSAQFSHILQFVVRHSTSNLLLALCVVRVRIACDGLFASRISHMSVPLRQ